MKEEHLLTGKLEPTNEGYAISKICGLKLCETYNKQYKTNFISLMPPNIYGPNDHFEPEKSHVVSALITRFAEAKEKNKESLAVWGTGNVKREFLFVDDCADAIVYFMKNKSHKEMGSFVNIGSSEEISIKNLAYLIKDSMGFKGEITFDTSQPEGMMRKLLDNSKAANLGWKAKTSFEKGLKKTVDWYLENKI